MAWFKVDDALYDHPKFARISLGAIGLWTAGGSFCAKHLTNGFLGEWSTPMLRPGVEDARAELVEAGLWVEVEGGVQYHDWDDYQPSRDAVLADRAAAKERQRRARDAARKKADDARHGGSHAVTDAVTHAVTSPEVTPFVTGDVTPPPTRPDPSLTTTASTSVDGAFETWWATYPRKLNKQAASKSWRRSVKRAGSPDIVLSGLRSWLPQWAGKEIDYVPYPTTWLNQDRWADHLESGAIDVDAILGHERYQAGQLPESIPVGSPAAKAWYAKDRDEWQADRVRRATAIATRRSA